MFGRKRRVVDKEAGRISPFLIRRKQTGVCEAYQLSQLRIVLLGESGAGKSSAGNAILGREVFRVGGGTGRSLRGKGEVEGREVSVIDTPGWGPGGGASGGGEAGARRSLSLCPWGPHAFLLAVPVAWSLFSEPQRREAQDHLELFGDGVWRHTILLFTKADRLGDAPVQQQVERRGRDLQRLAEACGGRCHALSSRATPAQARQVTQLLEKIERMVVANDGWHYKPQTPPLGEWEGEGEGGPQRRVSEGEEALRLRLEEKEREVEEARRSYKLKTQEQEEEQRNREEEYKLIFEEQQRNKEEEYKLIFEEQQRNKEEELKLTFEEQQRNREEELKLTFEEQQRNKEEEYKLIFEEQQRNRKRSTN
ncbi:hypothetical protein ANANG_G00147280 [Anguilla anguilla]|uniref:GTPase IMAP family member 8 n=1 Tax=Anguilla anguilla TaxID=7936 RepID=A0A9D3MBZ9_ANGAN|nr:hypothetical protein ANANG_G00147280 [Anguilla anguilla]